MGFGHCARIASSIGTLIERTTLFVTLVKMDDATAVTAATAFGSVLNRIDAQQYLSLTYDQGGARWLITNSFPRKPASPSTSMIRTAPGNVGSTRTPTVCSASISPRGPTFLDTLKPSLMPLHGNSTPVRARASIGSALPNSLCQSPSTSLSIIINLLHFYLETALPYLLGSSYNRPVLPFFQSSYSVVSKATCSRSSAASSR